MSVSVGWPLALWGLLGCVLIVLLAIRSRFGISTGRLVATTLVRALVLALVVLAVADLRIALPTDEIALAAVIDGAPTIAPEERAALHRELTEVQAARPEVALRIGSPNAQRDAATELSAMVATMPRDRVRRAIVATDGRASASELATAIAASRRSGIEVSVIPMGQAPPIDGVAIAGLEAPRLVRAAETLDVAATVHASGARRARLEARIDGNVISSANIDVPEGTSSRRIAVTFPEDPGVHHLELAIVSEGDPVAVNNRWSSRIEVLPKPRVRLYHDPDRPQPVLARVLREAGMEVELASPRSAFTELDDYDRYALVIADEIDLGDLSEPQQQTLRSWVEQQGGGLITVTGANPVRRTPRILREIEPIEPPPALPEPRPLELVIVIDHSSSMSGGPMEAARRAGVAAVNALRRDALVGAVAFSGAADGIQRPLPMDQSATVIRFIQGLQANGGTNIADAIRAANGIMSSDPRYIHHVILVSDGESDPQPAIAAAMSLAGRGVSISTITIGPYSQLLAEIARIGRGRYHTTSVGGLTSLVVSEAMYRQPPAHRQVSFQARESTHLSMLDGLDVGAAPPLTGHALAAARRGATVALTATEGMPLLAHWHRGLGQVATFTSATSGRWADAFREWPGFRQLWASLARGMLRSRTIEPPRVVVERDPLDASVRIVTVTSPFTEMEPAPVARVFRGAAGAPLALVPRGPGVYGAELDVGDGFLVDARMPFDPEPTAAAGAELPYPEDLAAFGTDAPMLERLARLGGGSVLASGPTASSLLAFLDAPGQAQVMRAIRTPLLASALVLYLFSLLLLRLPDRRLAASAIDRPSRVPALRPSAAREMDRRRKAA